MNISLAAPIPVIICGLLIWFGSGWLCWTNWQRSGRRKANGRLELLRFLIITLLGFTLLRPEHVRRINRTADPEIVVMGDASASMGTRDLIISNTVVSRADWLRRQLDRQFWKPLEKRAKVSVELFANPSTNDAVSGTDLSMALETALTRHKNLKAAILMTDGDWNMGKSPLGAATRYREQNVPVFAFGVGRDSPLPDLSLDRISAPAYGLLGEQIAIPFKVGSHLPREVRTTITMIDQFGEAGKKEITIPSNGEVQDAILWSPRSVGEITATLKLPVESDEALADNNEQAFHIAVRVEKLKVLVVDSLPRWEYRYLRNALARDPGVEMHSLLFHPDLGPGGGNNYLSSFPGTKEVLSAYDVVFLGDVGIGQNELTAQDAEMLRGLVEQQASGLVFVPGRRGREATLFDSALKDLYPVALESGRPEGIMLQNESSLMLTPSGRRHLLTRFDSDENRNDELWKQLPGFFWSAAVEKARPGSEVLAVHSAMRNTSGRIPLLVTRPAGSGKVLFLGTDSAWRWRRGVEDKFHYRFWGQVVRWMAHQRHLSEKEGIRLSYSPETPITGDTVLLQSTVLDPAGFPVEQGPVVGKVISPNGHVERLEFVQVNGGWGVFKSAFTPGENGKYKVEVSAEQQGRHLETELQVSRPQIERLGQPVNAAILREIGEISRGAIFSIDNIDKSIEQISLMPEPSAIEQRVRLWAEPFWGGVILLLLTLYWVGRKLAGLI